jgi:hypothetical protein
MLRAEDIGWSLAEPEFRKHLEKHGCGEQHISEQMSKIRAYLKPWLSN